MSFTSTGVSAQGSKLFVEIASVFTRIGNIKTFDILNGKSKEIDLTHMESAATEFAIGLPDFGTWKFDIDGDFDDAGQAECFAAQLDQQSRTFKFVLPTGATPNLTITGFVTELSSKGSVNDAWKGTLSVRVSGAPSIT